MPTQENIALMHRWFREVWNEGKIETVSELFAENGVAIGQAGPGAPEIHGPKEFESFVHRIRGAFPDIHVTIEDSFAAGDKVVLRWTSRMTHTGDDLDIPATNKAVEVTGMSIARIVQGKIVEGWDNWDQLGMMQQIGVHPRHLLAKTA
jgi:steroid delta-isomerase-like uncharacterized protein